MSGTISNGVDSVLTAMTAHEQPTCVVCDNDIDNCTCGPSPKQLNVSGNLLESLLSNTTRATRSDIDAVWEKRCADMKKEVLDEA